MQPVVDACSWSIGSARLTTHHGPGSSSEPVNLALLRNDPRKQRGSCSVCFGATRIVVLPTGLSCELKRPPRGAAAVALHALNVLIMRQLVDDLNRYAGEAELVTLPPLCPLEVSAYDFSQSASLIRRAESQSRRWLSHHGLHAQGTPGELTPHDHAAAA